MNEAVLQPCLASATGRKTADFRGGETFRSRDETS
jgi:hypothetical protein